MSIQTKDDIQTKCLAELFQHHKAGVAVSMGVGKTRIGLRHARNMFEFGARKFLVVAPKKAIYKSWKDEIELLDWGFLLDHITFTTYRSLHKLKTDYDAVYLDECHSLLPTHVSFLRSVTGKIIGLTGTPPRREGTSKHDIVKEFCPIVYTYITDDAVKEQILNDYKIIIHSVKLDTDRTYRIDFKNGGSMVSSEWDNYDFWSRRLESCFGNPGGKKQVSIARMVAMKKYPSKERYMQKLISEFDDKAILFCNTQEQADRMSRHSFHSGNPESENNLQLFKDEKIPFLSCVNQLNEGVNIPNLRYGVIMHAYGNERQASQRIGRLLRLNPEEKAYVHILMFEDTIDEHWVQQATQDFDQNKIEYLNTKPKKY